MKSIYNNKAIYLWLSLFVFFYHTLLLECEMKEQKIVIELEKSPFIGDWLNDDNWEETGEKFSLQFIIEEEKLVAIYTSGGPFEEILRCEIISENQVDLYYDYLAGSSSFMKINKSKKSKCKNKIASCYIENASLRVQTFEDKCGYIPKDLDIILKVSK